MAANHAYDHGRNVLSPDNSPADSWQRLALDVLPIPLCFALLIALWGLALGEAPSWAWAGLAWYGGLGAWGVVEAGRRQLTR